MAHNLARWTARIGLGERIATTKTLRRRFFAESLAGLGSPARHAASPCIVPQRWLGKPWHGSSGRRRRPQLTRHPSPPNVTRAVRSSTSRRVLSPPSPPYPTSPDGHKVSPRRLKTGPHLPANRARTIASLCAAARVIPSGGPCCVEPRYRQDAASGPCLVMPRSWARAS